MLQISCQMNALNLWYNSAANAPMWSPWRTESLICRKRNRPIDSKYKNSLKKEGANDQYAHDNEASAIKEHIDITLHKILKKVQVPEIMKNEKISISYVLLELISNNRRRYLWYEVALNDINCDEDLEFKSVI